MENELQSNTASSKNINYIINQSNNSAEIDSIITRPQPAARSDSSFSVNKYNNYDDESEDAINITPIRSVSSFDFKSTLSASPSTSSLTLNKKDKDGLTHFNSTNALVGEKTHEQSDSDESTLNDEKAYNEEEDDFPEGGRQAWLVVFGSFCGFVPCFGLMNIGGVIENYIQDHQLKEESSSTIGWIFSLMFFICFSSCIFSGTYFDRNGFKAPIVVGSLLHVAGIFSLANCTKYWHFIIAFSILCGLANGILMSPLMGAPAHFFKRKRGTATALATVGGSVGGGLFPLMLRKFFSMSKEGVNDYGYMWGIRTLGFIDLALLCVAVTLGKERLPHVVDAPRANESRFRHILRVYLLQSLDVKAFADMKYFFCVFGTVLGELSLTSAITYYSSYAMSQGISQSDSYMLIMTINLVGIPGRWVPGFLSDVVGRFNIAIITLTSLSLIMFIGWLPFGTNLRNMYAISVLYGFFSGSIFSLLPVCCGQISKTEEFGRRYSTMYFVVSFVTLAGIPITGAIIGNKSVENYQHYVIFSAATCLASAICYVISRAYCVGFKLVKF